MRGSRAVALLVVLAAVAAGELGPTFSVRLCAQRATDIVLVETAAEGKGAFRVVGVWKGALAKGALIRVPEVAEVAEGTMVLFLRREDGEGKTKGWEPAGFTLETSVAWVAGDEVTSIQQPRNPGPAIRTAVPWLRTFGQLEGRVRRVLESDRLLERAKQAKDVRETIALCGDLLRGRFDDEEEALKLLGQCGQPAVATLQAYATERPLTHMRCRAIPALAEAAGRDALPVLARLLSEDRAYFEATAPTLERGWWFDTTGEASTRHHRIGRLARAFSVHPYTPARADLVALRHLFQATPAIEGDDRIGKCSPALTQAIRAIDMAKNTPDRAGEP